MKRKIQKADLTWRLEPFSILTAIKPFLLMMPGIGESDSLDAEVTYL